MLTFFAGPSFSICVSLLCLDSTLGDKKLSRFSEDPAPCVDSVLGVFQIILEQSDDLPAAPSQKFLRALPKSLRHRGYQFTTVSQAQHGVVMMQPRASRGATKLIGNFGETTLLFLAHPSAKVTL